MSTPVSFADMLSQLMPVIGMVLVLFIVIALIKELRGAV
jgi:hypothetical protein